MTDVVIREIASTDSVNELTTVLRQAYAIHAKRGLRFWATYQTAEETAEVELYRDPAIRILNQFAVATAYSRPGVGHTLHNAVLAHALQKGALRILLDTAEPATELIAMYKRWGYRFVGTCDWQPFTNYTSVIMQLDLSGSPQLYATHTI